MADGYDVVVIGAGFAGLVAARDLSTDGHSVVLLEARERTGGRTYTGDAFGRRVDFGGAYAHWTQPHIWRELVRYGIGLSPPLEIDKILWLADGALHSGTQAEYDAVAAPVMTRYVGDARAWFPLPFNLSAVDTSAIERETLEDRMNALDLSPYDRDVLDGMLSTLVHSYGEQGIAQLLLWTATYFGHWAAFFETAGSWPIEGGTRRLLDAILGESSAELRLSTPVVSIDDDGSGVVATTRAGERVRARSAVVALPLNALGDVAITPDVAPPVRTMIDRKHPMRTVKVWVRVRGELEPFMAFAPVGENAINTARVEYHHDGDTIIVCFGSDASAIDAQSPEAVQHALRAFVADVEVLETASHDWVADPFSQGTWVHHRPGDLTGTAPLMRKPHGRIHFAGGDIAPIVLGGIEGALETGTEAARSIAARLADGTY